MTPTPRLFPILPLLLLTVPDATLANGRFPAAGQLVVDPAVPTHIVTRTTYGLVTTQDAGINWDWICENGVGYSSTTPIDPAMAITYDGSILAAFGDGLSVSIDGCTWAFATGGIESQSVVDVSTERSDPSHAVAITSTSQGGGIFLTQLYESLDNARTFSQAGIDLPADIEAETLDVAPSNSQCVYVSGVREGTTGVLVRSSDRGTSWESLDITWSGGAGSSDADHRPFIAGVDPVNEDTVYVRLSGTPGRLMVTNDGGDSWALAFEGQGSLKGFALSPDGFALLVGGDSDGTWRASTSSLAFESVSSIRPQCLTWVEAGVYACALEYNDGFTIGYSTDDGSSWEPVHYLSCVRGPLECPEGSNVQLYCEDAWAATAELIDQQSCYSSGDDDAVSPTPVVQATPTDAPSDGDGSTGCSCRTGVIPNERGSGTILLGVMAAWFRSRRGRKPGRM